MTYEKALAALKPQH